MNKKIYFASDVHLGFPSREESLKREKLIVSWMKEIEKDAEEVFFVGDIFDFWYEYKHIVPKGFVRFLGQVAHMVDNGIKVHFFGGNHDTWVGRYFEEEIGAEVHPKHYKPVLYGKKFYIAHGDEVGKHDWKLQTMKNLFRNKILQWCFSRLHPNFAFGIANAWSHKSRESHEDERFEDLHMPNEFIYNFCMEKLQSEDYDYMVFGHRHIPMEVELKKNSKYINTGTWLNNSSYAVFDGQEMKVKTYQIT